MRSHPSAKATCVMETKYQGSLDLGDSSPRGSMARLAPASIVRVRIEKLFGMYTYDLQGPNNLGRTPILYGENGLGKTNVLRILFHLLSPAPDRGHRSALGRIRFQRADVWLSNSILVSASRSQKTPLEGQIRLEVNRLVGSNTKQLLGAWDWFPKGDPGRETSQRLLSHIDPATARLISRRSSSTKEKTRAIQSVLVEYFERESNPLESEDAFLKALQENVPPIYFLSADRTLGSDRVPRESIPFPEADLRGLRPDALVAKGRERAIDEAISMASHRLSSIAFRAARQGTRSMHSIYQDLISRLAAPASAAASEQPEALLAELTGRLLQLSERYDLYSKYGLAPQLRGDYLVQLLNTVRLQDYAVAAAVLRPYVESLTEQANSFAQAYQVIDTLVSTVNDFLFDKRIEFNPGDGMIVRSKLEEKLRPNDLSSGEQQLLLLFCHIAIAHDDGGIFIIDEPEISLNIKWQRRLVDALWRMDPAENLQFILASHSMEILSKHRNAVVTLEDVGDS